MKLNCRRGDLAVIARTAEEFKDAIGHVAQCVEATPGHPFLVGWIIEPPVLVKGISYNACADWCLRPIRNPGDDAADETLTWAGLPGGVLA